MRAALLALVVFASGCVAPAVVDEPHVDPPMGSFAFALDEAHGIRAGDVAASVRPLEWGWFQWLEGVEAPAWASEPATEAFVVTQATATVVYTAMHPVTSPGARPEFTVWFGVEDFVSHHAFADGPAALAQGDEVVVPFELRLPAGGLVVMPGERLVLKVGSYYADDAQQGGVAIVLGSPDGSRLDFAREPVRLPVATSDAPVVHEARVEGGRCMGLDPLTETDLVWIPVEIDASVVGLDVMIDRVGGDGPPDVDGVLLDPEGTDIAHAQGSGGHEAMLLRAPNIAAGVPGEWMLGVYACTLQRGDVQVSVTLHRA